MLTREAQQILEKFKAGQIRRINVVGTSGSGKSTFARKVAEKIRSPYIEMDKIFWEPNWKEKEDHRFLADLEAALQGDRWVLDGNYYRTQNIKWRRVDLVIWLDFSFPVTFFRALRRALWRATTKAELWEGTGNKESFRKTFLKKDSILWWTIASYPKTKERYSVWDRSEVAERGGEISKSLGDGNLDEAKLKVGYIDRPFLFLRLKNPQQADLFLENIPCVNNESSAK